MGGDLALHLWANSDEKKVFPFSEWLLLLCRYGFGEAGKPKYGIQGNAELVYEVTLKSFEKVRTEVPQSLPGFQECQGLCSLQPLSLAWLQPNPC